MKRNSSAPWRIAHEIASQSTEPLSVMMTYPCSGQYECLTVITESWKSCGIHINLKGSSILAGNELLQYQEQMTPDQISLMADRIIQVGGLRRNEQVRKHPGLEFICALLSRQYGSDLEVVNAWHEVADFSGLDERVSQLSCYPIQPDHDWRRHAAWWGIFLPGTQNHSLLALLNLNEQVMITKTGMRIDLKECLEEALMMMDAMAAAAVRQNRMISERFETEMTQGFLKPLLDFVHNDNNLSVEIRRDYINIYYCGGNLLRIREKKSGYVFEFDIRYIKEDNDAKRRIQMLPAHVGDDSGADEWAAMLPVIKREMDTYFARHLKAEREFQQLVVRENNLSGIAAKTDYFICDIEYQVGALRFDLMAAKRVGRGLFRLALVEMKYADSALKGKSGLIDHVRTALDFLKVNDMEQLREEMLGILTVKQRLGLIHGLPKSVSFTNEKPEFVFLMANHKPASSVLEEELETLKTQPFYQEFCQLADLKIATGSFFGYGLYNECVYSLDEYEAINHAILNIAEGRSR